MLARIYGEQCLQVLRWEMVRAHIQTFTWKYELQADKTSLCACKCLPSADNVTSTRDSLFRRLENTEMKFGWWLFHLRQYCCIDIFGSTERTNQTAARRATFHFKRTLFWDFRGKQSIDAGICNLEISQKRNSDIKREMDARMYQMVRSRGKLSEWRHRWC